MAVLEHSCRAFGCSSPPCAFWRGSTEYGHFGPGIFACKYLLGHSHKFKRVLKDEVCAWPYRGNFCASAGQKRRTQHGASGEFDQAKSVSRANDGLTRRKADRWRSALFKPVGTRKICLGALWNLPETWSFPQFGRPLVITLVGKAHVHRQRWLRSGRFDSALPVPYYTTANA
jgi:hypothetical protein